MRKYEIVTLKDTKVKAFTNHVIATGKSGSGKSNAMEYMLENAFLFQQPKVKCIDIDVSDRLENCTYDIPEDDPLMLSCYDRFPALKKKFMLRPMSFKNEVLMICGRGLVGIEELPRKFKVVSYNTEDVTWDYLIYLLGNSDALIPTLNALQACYGTDINMKDIGDIFFHNTYRDEQAKYIQVNKEVSNMIRNRYISWMQTGIFSDDPQVEKIDFDELINEVETISCVNSFLLQEEWEEEMAMAIFLDKIIERVRMRKAKHRIYLFLREISDYMRWKLCKGNILKILRKGRFLGRTGIDLTADTQRALDLEPMIRRQFGTYFQMKSDMRDAEKLLEIQYIPEDIILKIPRLDVGQGLMATGSEWQYPVDIPPARHKHVAPGFDALKILGDDQIRSYDVNKIFGKKNWYADIPMDVKPEGKEKNRRKSIVFEGDDNNEG